MYWRISVKELIQPLQNLAVHYITSIVAKLFIFNGRCDHLCQDWNGHPYICAELLCHSSQMLLFIFLRLVFIASSLKRIFLNLLAPMHSSIGTLRPPCFTAATVQSKVCTKSAGFHLDPRNFLVSFLWPENIALIFARLPFMFLGNFVLSLLFVWAIDFLGPCP